MTSYKMAFKELFAYFIIFAGIACITASVCMNVAVKSANAGYPAGGWRERSISELSDDTKERLYSYIDQAVSSWNGNSNDMRSLRVVHNSNSEPAITRLFTQVVAGTNFCMTFKAETDQCKNGMVNDVLCRSGNYECELKATQPLPFLLRSTPIGNIVRDVDCRRVDSKLSNAKVIVQ